MNPKLILLAIVCLAICQAANSERFGRSAREPSFRIKIVSGHLVDASAPARRREFKIKLVSNDRNRVLCSVGHGLYDGNSPDWDEECPRIHLNPGAIVKFQLYEAKVFLAESEWMAIGDIKTRLIRLILEDGSAMLVKVASY